MAMYGGLEQSYEGGAKLHEEPLNGRGVVSLQQPAQQGVIFFHCIFKVHIPHMGHTLPHGRSVSVWHQVLALLCYLLSNMLSGGSYVLTFVLVTLLSALDFWTVCCCDAQYCRSLVLAVSTS